MLDKKRKWDVIIFDDKDNEIHNDVIEASSKYEVKKIMKTLTAKTENGDSFSFKLIEEDS